MGDRLTGTRRTAGSRPRRRPACSGAGSARRRWARRRTSCTRRTAWRRCAPATTSRSSGARTRTSHTVRRCLRARTTCMLARRRRRRAMPTGGTTILLALLVQVLPVADLIRCLLRWVAAGWWYGVVGHQAPCNPSEHLCRCHEDGKDSPPPSLSLAVFRFKIFFSKFYYSPITSNLLPHVWSIKYR